MNKVRVLRKEKSLSQNEFAKLIGVSRQTISSMENGGTPNFDTMNKIANYFGLSVDHIFFDLDVNHDLHEGA